MNAICLITTASFGADTRAVGAAANDGDGGQDSSASERLRKGCSWLFAGLDRMLQKVPSAVFEASLPGVREYGLLSRAACLGVKFLEYSLAGMFCGFLGQGVANGMMLAK